MRTERRCRLGARLARQETEGAYLQILDSAQSLLGAPPRTPPPSRAAPRACRAGAGTRLLLLLLGPPPSLPSHRDARPLARALAGTLKRESSRISAFAPSQKAK